MIRKRLWTEEQLKDAVKHARSYAQVLKALSLKEAGGNYIQIKKYIQELNLDIIHFKGKAWNKGMRGIYQRGVPLDKLLVKGKYFSSFKLKRKLFAAGLKPHYCEFCAWSQKTSEGYLPLELDHINGDRYDNRLENLRVLCPNCHSLTPNHRGRQNIKARVVK